MILIRVPYVPNEFGMENVTIISASIEEVGFEDVDAMGSMLENMETQSRGDEEDSLRSTTRGDLGRARSARFPTVMNLGTAPTLLMAICVWGKNSV
jgi:hypothetical protein